MTYVHRQDHALALNIMLVPHDRLGFKEALFDGSVEKIYWLFRDDLRACGWSAIVPVGIQRWSFATDSSLLARKTGTCCAKSAPGCRPS